jgi:hypothetical protein
VSTEQEISSIHREIKHDLEKQVRELTHRLDIALEHEVACAEQRQRADMAEEREADIRKEIEDASSDASFCDNAEKLEALTLGLLKLSSGGKYRES